MKRPLALALCCALLGACSVFNPNPGEKEADTYIYKKEFDQAISIVEPLAGQGVPWAQLRLGIAYEYGQGKKQNHATAMEWYRKAAKQTVDLPWADGVHILSSGEAGYFNQNNDAKVAQYLVARLYAEGPPGVAKNLPEAWRWAYHVQQASGGSDILFCCENSKLKTRKIEAERIEKLLRDIEAGLPADTLTKLKNQAKHWKPD